METGASAAKLHHEPLATGGEELRAAPRFTLLIRAAKLVSADGEFVCVIRDVSETGVCVRLFHRLPTGPDFVLHMPGGTTYDLTSVWERGNEAGFRFTQAVEVEQLIRETGEFPKRGLRLGLCFPVTIASLGQQFSGSVENISQQGARIACNGMMAIDQAIRIEAPGAHGELREIRAKIRWRRDNAYGVVFDDTFSLGEFAMTAARLQAPTLLDG
jgi:PilZ domain